jgi:hypothetical protein
MTERDQERKPRKKVNVEKLGLDKETVQHLTDEEAEAAKGGVFSLVAPCTGTISRNGCVT